MAAEDKEGREGHSTESKDFPRLYLQAGFFNGKVLQSNPRATPSSITTTAKFAVLWKAAARSDLGGMQQAGRIVTHNIGIRYHVLCREYQWNEAIPQPHSIERKDCPQLEFQPVPVTEVCGMLHTRRASSGIR